VHLVRRASQSLTWILLDYFACRSWNRRSKVLIVTKPNVKLGGNLQLMFEEASSAPLCTSCRQSLSLSGAGCKAVKSTVKGLAALKGMYKSLMRCDKEFIPRIVCTAPLDILHANSFDSDIVSRQGLGQGLMMHFHIFDLCRAGQG